LACSRVPIVIEGASRQSKGERARCRRWRSGDRLGRGADRNAVGPKLQENRIDLNLGGGGYGHGGGGGTGGGDHAAGRRWIETEGAALAGVKALTDGGWRIRAGARLRCGAESGGGAGEGGGVDIGLQRRFHGDGAGRIDADADRDQQRDAQRRRQHRDIAVGLP